MMIHGRGCLPLPSLGPQEWQDRRTQSFWLQMLGEQLNPFVPGPGFVEQLPIGSLLSLQLFLI